MSDATEVILHAHCCFGPIATQLVTFIYHLFIIIIHLENFGHVVLDLGNLKSGPLPMSINLRKEMITSLMKSSYEESVHF